jgi:hypothetical protein
MRLEGGETHLASERMSVTKTKIVRLAARAEIRRPFHNHSCAIQSGPLVGRPRWRPGAARAGYEALPW